MTRCYLLLKALLGKAKDMDVNLDLSHLIEEPDIHQVYIARYCAEAATNKVWRLLHNLDHWTTIGRKPDHLEKRGSDREGTSKTGLEHSGGLAYADFKIEPCALLGFDGAKQRIYRVDLARAFTDMPDRVRGALEEHLSSKRYGAIFAPVQRWAMVRRVSTASKDAAKGAMLIGLCAIPLGLPFLREEGKVGVV